MDDGIRVGDGLADGVPITGIALDNFHGLMEKRLAAVCAVASLGNLRRGELAEGCERFDGVETDDEGTAGVGVDAGRGAGEDADGPVAGRGKRRNKVPPNKAGAAEDSYAHLSVLRVRG